MNLTALKSRSCACICVYAFGTSMFIQSSIAPKRYHNEFPKLYSIIVH